MVGIDYMQTLSYARLPVTLLFQVLLKTSLWQMFTMSCGSFYLDAAASPSLAGCRLLRMGACLLLHLCSFYISTIAHKTLPEERSKQHDPLLKYFSVYLRRFLACRNIKRTQICFRLVMCHCSSATFLGCIKVQVTSLEHGNDPLCVLHSAFSKYSIGDH